MTEDDPFSGLLVDVNSTHRTILLESVYINEMKNYLNSVSDACDSITKEIKHLEALQKEQTAKEQLLDESIQSADKTLTVLKDHKYSLLKQFEAEEYKTTKEKKNLDSIVAKYEETWVRHEEIYNSIPYVREKVKLQNIYKLKLIQLMQFKVSLKEIRMKCFQLQQIQARQEQVVIVKLAKAYSERQASLKKSAAIGEKFRKLNEEVEAIKSEKQKFTELVNNRQKDYRYTSCTGSGLSVAISMPAVNFTWRVPELQLPSWYSPPAKIRCCEETIRSISRSSTDSSGSQPVNEVVDLTVEGPPEIKTTGTVEENQNVTAATVSTENTRETVTCQSSQPESVAEAPDVPEPSVTANIQLQAHPDECMDLTASPSDDRCVENIPMETDPIPVLTPQKTVTPEISRPTSSDMRDRGECVNQGTKDPIAQGTQVPNIQDKAAVDVGSSHEDFERTSEKTAKAIPEFNLQQTTSDNTAAMPQASMQTTGRKTTSFLQPLLNFMDFNSSRATEKPNSTVENMTSAAENVVPTQPTTHGEDDVITSMDTEDVQCITSPCSDVNMTGSEGVPDQEQTREEYRYTMSPDEFDSSGFQTSPQRDYMMTSPPSSNVCEGDSLRSPPFYKSPEFPDLPLTNTNLFGPSSSGNNNNNNNGFSFFTFGAPNGSSANNAGTSGTNTAGGGQKKADESFQFSFGASRSSPSSKEKSKSTTIFQMF